MKIYFYWIERRGAWSPEVVHDPHPAFFNGKEIADKREITPDVAGLPISTLAKLFPMEAKDG